MSGSGKGRASRRGLLPKLAQGFALAKVYRAYRARRARGVAKPVRLWIEPTDRCNLHCVMCPTGTGEFFPGGPGFMTFETFAKVIDEAKEFAFDVNLHHRGESLIHKELPRMIRYAADAGLFTNLHTNGTLLDAARSRAILDSGLDFLSVSFDALDPEEYPRVRPGAKFEKTLEAVRTFLRLRAETGAKRPFVAVEAIDFHPGDGRSNEEKRTSLAALFPADPPDRVRVKALHNWAGSAESGSALDTRRFAPCTFLWYSLTVLWDGRVMPCPQDTHGHLALGNVADSSLAAIWDGDALVSLREKMARAEWQDLVPCRTCDRIFRTRRAGLPTEGWREFLWENLTR